MVLVCFDYCSVYQLLKLHIIEVVAHHHLEDHEELSVRDETIVVDVVDLESKPKFLLLGTTSTKRIKTLHEFKETNAAVLVFI